MDKLKKLREDRVEKEDALSALVKEAETKSLSAEQKEKFNQLEEEIKAIDADIEFEEKVEARKKELAKKKIENEPRVFAEPQDNASEKKELSKIAKTYSFAKAFQDIYKSKRTSLREGVEREMYEEAVRETRGEDGEGMLQGNIAIPSKMVQVQTKAFDVATEGADNVFTEYGGFIPILKPEPVTGMLGISVYSGLRGDVQWVRHNGDVAFAWETETSDVDETTPTLNNISVAPKRVGGYTEVTIQQLKQSVFSLEPWLRRILQERYALTVDDAVLNGSGSSNEPTGIFNYSGVNTLSLGSGASTNDMTYEALLSMIRDTKTNNARRKNAGWITNAYGEFALKTTPKQSSGVEGNFIMGPNDESLFSRKFISSETIPSDFSEASETDLVGIIYSSNWSSAILATWGGLDILFDPYTQALGAKIRFVCNAFMDVEVEQPKEFTICKDWDATDTPALT